MKKICIALFICSCFCACHKSADTPLLEEHPLEDYIYNNAKGASEIAMPAQAINDIGYRFFSSRNGRVIKIGCRNPNTRIIDSAAVSLWDPTSHQLLLQKTIFNTDPSNFIYANLQASNQVINLADFTEYIVSVHFFGQQDGMQVYRLVRQDFKGIIPLTDQAITIDAEVSGTNYSPVPVFPSFVYPSADNNDVYGLADIGFQANDF